MLSNTTQRRKQIARDWSNDVEAGDRYVDIGVHLRVVRADPNGEVLIPGGRPMVVVDERNYGGMLDTATNPPHIPDDETGESQNPQQWFCSEDQFKLIEHLDTDPIGKLALGGMGAGKTTAGVIWLYRIWLEHIHERAEQAADLRVRAAESGLPEPTIPSAKEGGITAPTETRLTAVLNEMRDRFPRTWWTFNSETKIVTMADKFRWRGVSTHRQSEKQGSRIQQFNWIALLMDELQDQTDEFVNAQARLRSKLDGRAKRIATATAKDEPEWRALKDGVIGSGLWSLHSMLGPDSPFIHPDHWSALKAVTDDREYRRLVMAEDLPSESRLYYTFDRKENIKPIPLGARKITSIVLARKTGERRDALLMGHDPGAAKAASVWLDAYEVPQRKGEVLWWVRDELFTLHKTTEEHATLAMKRTRDRFGVNVRADEERAHVRCQPLGAAEDKPDINTFTIWQRIGFHIKWAHYNNQTGKGGQIKKESRIGMVNTLFCNAEGKRRLFIECDDRGVSPCKDLIAALETMERDHKGRPEHEEKHVRFDKSDLPAALGYALYPFEKETATALRSDIRKSLG